MNRLPVSKASTRWLEHSFNSFQKDAIRQDVILFDKDKAPCTLMPFQYYFISMIDCCPWWIMFCLFQGITLYRLWVRVPISPLLPLSLSIHLQRLKTVGQLVQWQSRLFNYSEGLVETSSCNTPWDYIPVQGRLSKQEQRINPWILKKQITTRIGAFQTMPHIKRCNEMQGLKLLTIIKCVIKQPRKINTSYSQYTQFYQASYTPTEEIQNSTKNKAIRNDTTHQDTPFQCFDENNNAESLINKYTKLHKSSSIQPCCLHCSESSWNRLPPIQFVHFIQIRSKKKKKRQKIDWRLRENWLEFINRLKQQCIFRERKNKE